MGSSVQGRHVSEFQVFDDDDLREISLTEVSYRTPSDRTYSRRKRFVNNYSRSFVCQQRKKYRITEIVLYFEFYISAFVY